MKFNPSMIKMWSRIGSRASFGMAALELGKIHDKLIIISGDTSTSAGLERFKNNFPDKYLRGWNSRTKYDGNCSWIV